MTALDIEGVLRDHMFSMSTNKCVCGVGPRRGQVWFDHRTHVAAVLREQIAWALEAEAWERGYRKGGSDRITSEVTPNPYRAALVAPSRVPGEET